MLMWLWESTINQLANYSPKMRIIIKRVYNKPRYKLNSYEGVIDLVIECTVISV